MLSYISKIVFPWFHPFLIKLHITLSHPWGAKNGDEGRKALGFESQQESLRVRAEAGGGGGVR